MKIVHVEDVFHPDTGYQLNLLSRYMAAAGHEVVIITSEIARLPKDFMTFFGADNIEERDSVFTQKYGVRIIRIPTNGYYSGRVFLSKEFMNAIKKENPSIVYVHGNDTLTGMRYLLNLKKMQYPLVMDSHMLDMAAKNRFKSLFRLFYRKTITPIIIKNRIPVIRTQDSDYVEKALGIPLEQAPWISTGSDTMLFKKDNIVRHDMRERIGIEDDEFVITYAGKLDEAKGGLLLADALIDKINADRKICFVVIGNTVGEYGRKVEDAFNKSKNRIIRFQTQKYNDLAAFFKMSDLVLFPKQCSLSFYDAQACGIPVLFENNEINIKRSLSGGAIMFEQENCEDLRNKIVQFINMDYSDYQELCDSAQSFIREFYDYKKICDIYLKVIADEIDNYKAYGYS